LEEPWTILNIDGDAANIRHVAEQDVAPEEAEEIVLGDSMEMDFDVVSGEERWSYVGETGYGRLLRVLFTMRSDRVRVVTAFEPSPLQKRIFLRWKVERQGLSR
jgi:uncharacterized DUF497 family protein